MKFVLAMLFPMAMTGTTISATVDCGSGPIGGIGVSLASCSVPEPLDASAFAKVSFASPFPAAIDLDVAVDLFSMPAMASAMTNFDLLVNVTGSTGNALFVPCFTGGGNNFPLTALATVEASIGGGGMLSSVSEGEPIDNCGERPVAGFGQSFTFGEPFTVDLTLSGEAESSRGEASGGLTLGGDEILDADGHPIPGAIISVTILPEPNAALMMMLSLALILVMARLRGRYRFR